MLMSEFELNEQDRGNSSHGNLCQAQELSTGERKPQAAMPLMIRYEGLMPLTIL
jgi:hypothetical protein